MAPLKDSPGGGDVDYDNDKPERLNINSTLVEIADAMKTTGLNFVNKAVQGMPPSTFLAFEAVNWIMENIRGKRCLLFISSNVLLWPQFFTLKETLIIYLIQLSKKHSVCQ